MQFQRNKMLSRRDCTAISITLLFVLSGSYSQADAGRYEIKSVVDNTGRYYRVDVPTINEHGETAAQARISHEFGNDVYLIVENGVISELYEENANFISTHHVRINDNGTLLFRGYLDGFEGFYMGNGGSITTIASGENGYAPSGIWASINDSEIVAFHGEHAGELGLYLGNGGMPTEIPIGNGIPSFGIPEINNHGEVAYWGGVNFGSQAPPVAQGIFLYDGTQTITIAETADQYLRFMERVSINNKGQVLFMAVDNDPCIAQNNCGPYVTGRPLTSLLVGDGGNLTSLVDGSGAYLDFSLGFDINDSGNIAFFALLDDERKGVFTGADPITDRIVVEGDPLFGSTVADLSFVGHGGLNNRGQVAFRYLLANGIHGVAVATPVPEPCSMWLLIVTVLGVSVFKSWEQRFCLQSTE